MLHIYFPLQWNDALLICLLVFLQPQLPEPTFVVLDCSSRHGEDISWNRTAWAWWLWHDSDRWQSSYCDARCCAFCQTEAPPWNEQNVERVSSDRLFFSTWVASFEWGAALSFSVSTHTCTASHVKNVSMWTDGDAFWHVSECPSCLLKSPAPSWR